MINYLRRVGQKEGQVKKKSIFYSNVTSPYKSAGAFTKVTKPYQGKSVKIKQDTCSGFILCI